MKFNTRKHVKPPDLSPSGALMGGVLMEWIDEEASIFVICQLNNNKVVTKYMSEVEFVSPAYRGDIIEIGCELTSVGRTSVTLKCLVRVKGTETVIVTIDKIVFVNMDGNGRSKPHGLTMEMIKQSIQQ
ncbi:MAG: hotdog domain-containing protein [Candidatus Kapaibacterium sp.]|nr:acyl-CoA thioesterase [Ignavibacteriota bacterium]MCB9220411.1 acyl-CoA thioesterase [Ignavibacteria bacterium]